MITIRALGGEGEQFQAVCLLIVLVNEAPYPDLTAFVEVEFNGIRGKGEPPAAYVVSAVRVRERRIFRPRPVEAARMAALPPGR